MTNLGGYQFYKNKPEILDVFRTKKKAILEKKKPSTDSDSATNAAVTDVLSWNDWSISSVLTTLRGFDTSREPKMNASEIHSLPVPSWPDAF